MDIIASKQESPTLIAAGLCFGYSGSKCAGVEIFRDLNFQCDAMQSISIMGRSGVGKTTLCRLLAGLLRPSGGNITLYGQKLLGPTTDIGIMFQDSPCFPWLTVEDNIRFGYRGSNRDHLNYLIDRLGLASVRYRYPKELSGGMRQRVALGRALAVDPSCLIMDEPFSALDIVTKSQIIDLIKHLQEEKHFGAIYVLHSLEDAVATSDKILVLGSRPAKFTAQFDLKQNREFRILRADVSNAMMDLSRGQ